MSVKHLAIRTASARRQRSVAAEVKPTRYAQGPTFVSSPCQLRHKCETVENVLFHRVTGRAAYRRQARPCYHVRMRSLQQRRSANCLKSAQTCSCELHQPRITARTRGANTNPSEGGEPHQGDVPLPSLLQTLIAAPPRAFDTHAEWRRRSPGPNRPPPSLTWRTQCTCVSWKLRWEAIWRPSSELLKRMG